MAAAANGYGSGREGSCQFVLRFRQRNTRRVKMWLFAKGSGDPTIAGLSAPPSCFMKSYLPRRTERTPANEQTTLASYHQLPKKLKRHDSGILLHPPLRLMVVMPLRDDWTSAA